MKNVSTLFFCLMMMTMSLSGCIGGDDAAEEPDDQNPTTGGELDDWDVHFAATSGDLPECSAATLGRLYYVDADSEFQACMPTGWQTIEITGPAGIAGPPGSSATLEEGCFNTETGTKYAVAMLMPDEEDLKLLCEGFAWEFNEGDGAVPGYCYNDMSGDNYSFTEYDCKNMEPLYSWWPGGNDENGNPTEVWDFDGDCGVLGTDLSIYGGQTFTGAKEFCLSFRWVEEQTGFWECVNPHATVTAQMMVNEMDMATCDSFKWVEGSSESTPMNGINGASPLITSDYSDMCPSGGSTFKIGMDLDSNGILDSMEIITSLDICNGMNGQDGLNGTDGQDGLNGTDGQDGADGADGVTGPDGADGTSVNIVGSVATVGDLDSNYQGNVGDGYIVSSTGHLHIWDGSAWVDAGNITGPDGADGADGVDGDDGAAGVDGDDGAAGVDGDDGAAGVDGDDGSNTLISTTTEPAGSNCANGGTRIDMGVDDDGDGTLDTTEIDHTQYICDGSDGSASANTMLTSQSNITSASCTWAERAIQSGLDNGDGGGTAANGVLENGEVDFTTIYCISLVNPSLLKDINAGAGSAIGAGSDMVVVNGISYFTANDGTNGNELWKSDGTTAGTVMVMDINLNNFGSSDPSDFIMTNGALCFFATDGISGYELWSVEVDSSGQITAPGHSNVMFS